MGDWWDRQSTWNKFGLSFVAAVAVALLLAAVL